MGADQSRIFDESSNRLVKQNNVGFFINGKEYNVNTEVDKIGPRSTLLDYIRDRAGLKGTKWMCREGGCGACVVSVKSKDPNTGSDMIRAVNSCLVPVLCADGWEITTVEGLGNKKDGYNPIQQQIVKFSATQCGFCTPGMIMNMHSLSKSNPDFKLQDVEDLLDGNFCRCTGYRPILDAFKSLTPKKNHASCHNNCPMKPSGHSNFEGIDWCNGIAELHAKLGSGDEEWVKPNSLASVYEALSKFTQAGIMYRIVAGNSGTGVFKEDSIRLGGYLDVNGIPDLKHSIVDEVTGLQIGAGTTMVEAIHILEKAADLVNFTYAAKIAKHLKRIANVPVRNIATIGGNLMLKHRHRDFPSDLFVLLEGIGAKVVIGFSPSLSKEYTVLEFLKLDMNGKLLLCVTFPEYEKGTFYFRTFKVARRYQSDHAVVNAAIFLPTKDAKNPLKITQQPRIVFGGISPQFAHAYGTEDLLNGKILDKGTLSTALSKLAEEVNPDDGLLEALPKYRKLLAQAVFYKTILGLAGKSVKPELVSGGQDLEHQMSHGQQSYDPGDKSEWPLHQPIPKIEAAVQASGEAKYINDLDPGYGELFGAFVISSVGNCTLGSVDASEALMIPGVVKFIQARDIPGVNNHAVFFPSPEEVFATSKISYAGQSIGLILAETRAIAMEAVKRVKVSYEDMQRPIIDLKEAIKLAETSNDCGGSCTFELGRSETSKVSSTQKISGEFRVGTQYHMAMETQTCICIPKEDGMDVYPATQYADYVQAAVSGVLGMPAHAIDVTVRRLGGGFGSKITRANYIACACAVGAHLTQRPVRIVLDLETNMRMIGNREPFLCTYEAEVDDKGVIVGMKAVINASSGYSPNESTADYALQSMQNVYRATVWKVTSKNVLTNTAANTPCRSPGSTQGIAFVEMIMEHIAHSVKKDPIDVRLANMMKDGDPLLGSPGETFKGENPMPKMIQDAKAASDYDKRKQAVEDFNKKNRFRKRGLSLVPVRYILRYGAEKVRFAVFISVYHIDGTVSVSHGGIEMGQGINTKCAQTVAKFLNVPLAKIKIKPTNTIMSPNEARTSGSRGSDLVCHSAIQACQKLLDKMKPVRDTMKGAKWEDVVKKCFDQNILLTSQHQDPPGPELKGYDIWATCVTEVEVDVLTGEYKVARVDLNEDAGLSLSPEVDIGQIEGAFVMGVGLWTTEKHIYDKNTGQLLTCSTWEYKPPFSKDIPEDFRVSMIKNRPNPSFGILRSKATGEPPLCCSCGVLFALKNAIDSARRDAGNNDWYQIDGPVTPEDIQRLALTSPQQFEM